jgi:hypothetical protein
MSKVERWRWAVALAVTAIFSDWHALAALTRYLPHAIQHFVRAHTVTLDAFPILAVMAAFVDRITPQGASRAAARASLIDRLRQGQDVDFDPGTEREDAGSLLLEGRRPGGHHRSSDR